MHIRLFIWWNRIKQAQGHDCSDLAQSGQCFSAASTEKAIFHPNSFLSFLSKHIWQPILAPPLLLRPQKQPVTGCASRVGMGKCLLWKASLHFYKLLGLGKWDPEERGLHSSVIPPTPSPTRCSWLWTPGRYRALQASGLCRQLPHGLEKATCPSCASIASPVKWASPSSQGH